MEEKILYQFVMNYKAYRREAVIIRSLVALVIAGGALGLCAVSIPLGIVIAVAVVALGGISVIFAFGVEQTYTVYNSRVVIKTKSKRKSMPLDGIKSVRYRRAFYEKDLATGTITVSGKDDRGRSKRLKLKHVFDAQAAADFLKQMAQDNVSTDDTQSDVKSDEA